MKVMITGAAGFIGGFLARHCVEAGCSVLGFDIKKPGNGWSGAPFEQCDIRDTAGVQALISTFRPERIFHLAAQSYPTVSLSEPRETMDINAGGTINVFECVRKSGTAPVIVVACSSAEYGPVASSELPVREGHPLRPLHPYGVSKVAQDLLTAQYFANYGISGIRMRIFNTTGAGKQGDVCSDLTRRAIEIELGLRPPILMVGNVTSRRAIVDVRDMVRGLWLASERGEAGEVYNISGNRVYAVQDILEAIRCEVKVAFDIEQDPVLMRGCDEPVIAGDSCKFQQCSGWRAEVALSSTLRDMLEWWRQRLSGIATPQGSVLVNPAVNA